MVKKKNKIAEKANKINLANGLCEIVLDYQDNEKGLSVIPVFCENQATYCDIEHREIRCETHKNEVSNRSDKRYCLVLHCDNSICLEKPTKAFTDYSIDNSRGVPFMYWRLCSKHYDDIYQRKVNLGITNRDNKEVSNKEERTKALICYIQSVLDEGLANDDLSPQEYKKIRQRKTDLTRGVDNLFESIRDAMYGLRILAHDYNVDFDNDDTYHWDNYDLKGNLGGYGGKTMFCEVGDHE